MKKRELSKIPRPEATQEMITLANNLENMNYIGTVEETRLDNKKVLILNLFKIESLKNNSSEAELRIFFTDTDYITQDLTVSNVKWKTASMAYMFQYGTKFFEWGNYGNWKSRIFTYTQEEQKLLDQFFKVYKRKDDVDIFSAVRYFQQKVMDRRLEEKYRKETDPIDALMETVGEVPEDFENWINEEAMSFSHYLFYKAINKHEVEAVCSQCKNEMVIDRRQHRVYNNEKGTCPFCGKKVTYKARGKCGLIRDERWASYVEPRTNGFLWRSFFVVRRYEKDKYPNYEQSVFEETRRFYEFKNGKLESDNYEYTGYRQSGKIRWCHSEGKIISSKTTLYYKNLPEIWKDTPLKYSALEILSKNNPGVAIMYEEGMEEFLIHPFVEWLIKMGLNDLTKYIFESYGYENVVNYYGKTIYDILKLNKVNTRILQQLDGGWKILRLLQVSQEIGFTFKPEELQKYYETFECNTELLKQVNRRTSLHKIVKYIAKESQQYPIGDRACRWSYSYNRYNEREDIRIERKQNMAHDWLEYLGWCEALGYDLDNMFIYMPRNFKVVHDRTAREYQEFMDKKAVKEKKRREREAKRKMEQAKKAMAEIFSKNADVKDAFAIKGKGLILRVPQNAEEIKAEGAALHHCVGTYVEQVARGQTMILFIRKATEPDKPYYTLEWKNNRVVQCRGSHNKDMTSEVKGFVEVFEKKMLENIEKKVG